MALKRIDNGFGGYLVEPCFCKDTNGQIFWTDGQEYIRDGTAPGRINLFEFSTYHGIIMTYDWANRLELATPDEIERFCTNIVSHLEEEIADVQEECKKRVQLLRAEIEIWKARMKESAQTRQRQ